MAPKVNHLSQQKVSAKQRLLMTHFQKRKKDICMYIFENLMAPKAGHLSQPRGWAQQRRLMTGFQSLGRCFLQKTVSTLFSENAPLFSHCTGLCSKYVRLFSPV